ncbi:hypothetical protein K503DRAFT_774743 [Rhizopogon vinicolor AM-OR11-026]|uniref:Uncharacterized protein n=1 Tax=Rhizopogon vinicolor AM-OR11-026 TaxID=1314800 RepID=A0A1B7MNS9_9AGAM|nr:hypothetical protein K503DRAFT_774743 [Rhizopogon vinicolor AM-OR11-026]
MQRVSWHLQSLFVVVVLNDLTPGSEADLQLLHASRPRLQESTDTVVEFEDHTIAVYVNR